MQQESLFENKSDAPLASRLRPMSLDKFVGQKHLIGKGKILYRLIEADRISSFIFWGPPGVGTVSYTHLDLFYINCIKFLYECIYHQ